jgi:hypothetical protein
MKEQLIKYVMQKANRCYTDDFPIEQIEVWINEFFYNSFCSLDDKSSPYGIDPHSEGLEQRKFRHQI